MSVYTHPTVLLEALAPRIQRACQGLDKVNPDLILTGVQASRFEDMSPEDVSQSLVLSARSLIERHPQYGFVTARLLLQTVYQSVFGREVIDEAEVSKAYREGFSEYLARGVADEVLDERLLTYNVAMLAEAIDAEADAQFQFQGVQILTDRYLIRDRQRQVIELPQWLWMRVAMGLALNETDKELWAIRFYRVMKAFRYIPSTPTLFSAGTPHSQLSSCYLNTVPDSIEGIFKTYADNARLSKWAGGLGTDWTPVRATGAPIKGTNGESQGVVPWLKIDNDVAIAVNQGGKRKGAHCAYLETWHLDIEDFLELRKNVGDERRRTHDINTAHWIPDLFMKRVLAEGPWTLFSPDTVPELHDLYGQAFESAYLAREAAFEAGQLPGKRIEAKALWRKMLTMLFETGHPWMTFKDPCNVRSPQDHVGVVHSSNLCTEITLNTSKEETAVCNLGSVNLSQHVHQGQVDYPLLEETVEIAVRMLDNVIDINYYPTPEAERANQTHRAIGLGVMGYQDLLYALDVPFASQAHLLLADVLFERFSYAAISASAALAKERGAYASFKGSKWDRGVFPSDTLALLELEREDTLVSPLPEERPPALDWKALKKQVKATGLRHSNMMAIAPTATISNIVGTSPCIEPTFKNLYVTSNMSGEFTVINAHLVAELGAEGLWDDSMAERLKVVDGQLSRLPGIPRRLVEKYPDIFETGPGKIDQQWLLKAAAVRGRWLDQSQSLNLFVSQPSGKHLHALYTLAWQLGLKTTYYLRTLGASQVEKATVDTAIYGKTHQRQTPAQDAASAPGPQACRMDDPECEACQ